MTPDAAVRRGHLSLDRLTKLYGRLAAARDVTVEIKAGEFFTLLGPSGSGKTTTMMAVAGFVSLDSGTIDLDGQRLDRVPVERRNVGVVFQNYALFPHLTVYENLAFPLDVRGIKGAEARKRIGDILDLVQLGERANVYPTQLSGGQQQRVALARAIISEPDVLLMDEPLGALDKNLRAHLQLEIRRLQRELGVTTVYVTHDQDEAFTMSDRIAVMNNGHIEQVGTPEEIYHDPTSLFVANFVGENNDLSGVVTNADATAVEVQVENGPVLRCRPAPVTPGARVTVAVRPEALSMNTAPPGWNTVRGTVREAIFSGPILRYQVAVGADLTLSLREGVNAHERLTPGSDVEVSFPPDSVLVFGPIESASLNGAT